MFAVFLSIWKFFILTFFVSREIVQLIRFFQKYQKIEYIVSQFIDENRKIVQAFFVNYSQIDRFIRFEKFYRFSYFSQWFYFNEFLNNAVNQFRFDIARYRQIEIFRNFSNRSLLNSFFNNNSTTPSSEDQFWTTSNRSLQNILIDSFFHSFDAFINRKFRSNNVKRKKIRLSPKIRASNYFSFIDFFIPFDTVKQFENFNFRFIENSNIEKRSSNTSPFTHIN